jgi:hypothetical protein
MKIGEKEFSDYWKIIKIPVFVLSAWYIAGLICAIISFSSYTSIFSGAAGWSLMIIFFGFIGWTAVKDFKETIKSAAWAGALAGAIVGIVSGVVGVIMYYTVPSLMQYAINMAVQAGASALDVQKFMVIGVYI